MPLGYQNNESFYAKSIRKYGVSHKGVHWSSKYNQYIRFEVLTEFIQQNIHEFTIIDAGCGFAEYYFYLQKNRSLPKKYIGMDCENSMVFRSQMRFPSLDFHVKNILDDKLYFADYYVCSGALNILNKKEFYQFIKKCYHYSNKGFVFNFLIKDSFNKIDKKEVIQFCKKLSKHVDVKELYLYNDITIFMRKN